MSKLSIVLLALVSMASFAQVSGYEDNATSGLCSKALNLLLEERKIFIHVENEGYTNESMRDLSPSSLKRAIDGLSSYCNTHPDTNMEGYNTGINDGL